MNWHIVLRVSILWKKIVTGYVLTSGTVEHRLGTLNPFAVDLFKLYNTTKKTHLFV